jgi:hypothetical protein
MIDGVWETAAKPSVPAQTGAILAGALCAGLPWPKENIRLAILSRGTRVFVPRVRLGFFRRVPLPPEI